MAAVFRSDTMKGVLGRWPFAPKWRIPIGDGDEDLRVLG